MRNTKTAIVILAGAIASCGGAAGPAKSVEKRTVSSPDAALVVLDDAEAEIARVLGGPRDAFAHAPSASAAPVAPPPQQPVQGQVPGVSPPADTPSRHASAPSKGGLHADEAVAVSTDRCSTACAALASMERAAQHLCDLAGASDGRCANARDRVKNAASRVQAACPGCAR